MAGSLSPDGQHYWDGAKWTSAVSPSGQHYWTGTQWLPRQPQYIQPVVVEKRSGGAAKGCLIASGIGFVVLGGVFILSLIGFILGVICIVIGVEYVVLAVQARNPWPIARDGANLEEPGVIHRHGVSRTPCCHAGDSIAGEPVHLRAGFSQRRDEVQLFDKEAELQDGGLR